MSQLLCEMSIYIISLIISIIYYIDVISMPRISDKLVIIMVFWPLLILLVYQLVIVIKKIITEANTTFSASKVKALFKTNMFYLLIALTVYIILIPFIGFFGASFLGYCLLTIVLDYEAIHKNKTKGFLNLATTTVLFLVATYLLFVVFLKVVLPKGCFYNIWGIIGKVLNIGWII